MDRLFLGVKGLVVCVDKNTGDNIWSTKLKPTSGITNVFIDDELVFAHAGGHLFCLDINTGSIKWENPLKGMGYGPCIFATENQSMSVAGSDAAAQQSSVAISVSSADSGGDGDGGGE